MNQQPPIQSQPKSKKSKKGLKIGLLVSAAVLLILLIVFLILGKAASDRVNSQISDTVNGVQPDGPITLDNRAAITRVCEGVSFKNSAEYNESDTPLMTSATLDLKKEGWSEQLGAISDLPYYVDSDTDFKKINVVACMTQNDDKPAASVTCTHSRGDKITYIDSNYDIEYKEAKTNKVLYTDTATFKASKETCPYFSHYDEETKEGYALPDVETLEDKFDTFIKNR